MQNQPFAGLEEFVTENAPLARFTWYRIGGPARYLVRPRSVEELQEASRRCVESNIPIYVLGLGANLLIDDAGVDGAVFRFDAPLWQEVSVEGTRVRVGAGMDMQKLLVRTAREGLAGIESLAGIPGTIGGGIRMNCGGKFGDLGSFVQTVTVMDSHGQVFQRLKEDLVFGYRKSNVVAPFILDATLELDQDNPDDIATRMKEIWMYKRNTQPLNTKNCGCIFKNPPGQSAGALIDLAGLKGLQVGGAQVSEKHANFIVAHPGTTSGDIHKLIGIIRERVAEKHQIDLESEVRVWPLAKPE
ncbi:MAG TPA: UDP-N-acetylmuramate dehydrogenase [Tepidisphaeraceae bacterium]